MRLNKFIIRAAYAGTCGLLLTTTSKAQSSLDNYIEQGIASNKSIQQQGFILEKNIYALKEAKSLFLPSVTFNTSYTKAQGGRTIGLPLGDLLNNVYSSLNQLTGSHAFPQVANQKVLLNPDNFYDAHFRTSLPLLNAELNYNKRIKSQQLDLQKEEILLYKRELVKEIKTAYYQYLKAMNAVAIYQSSLELVNEGLRVNNALLKNEKANRTAVLRSENEVSRINASLTSAIASKESAKNYFNFLLNKTLTDSIIIDVSFSLPPTQNLSDQGVDKREELAKLTTAAAINNNVTGLAKSYLTPKISTFLDLGSQEFDWKFNSDSRYYLFGVSLEWNLFSFGRNTYKIKQAVADQKSIAAQTDYVKIQLQTELSVRQHEWESSLAQYQAAVTQQRTAQTYYGDEMKLYKEGLAIYIELLDAQNQLINARLQTNISLYDMWIAHAAIERATAGFIIQ
ncbi:Outer membrane protein TolC [Filimonas lacunae]|uniref:Outer membrane protein TolC n=1 Tax=Filimonas lacunae TaxID=477680 RepID=A0A173MC03_9BACT|nr:TolC family protein [Filimonas lacunae]BAV05056.1 outer membrane efflux protein [Filimonas lacunae]SIT34306.1 Outer membrane protein TolC [Filimonas lacunae]